MIGLFKNNIFLDITYLLFYAYYDIEVIFITVFKKGCIFCCDFNIEGSKVYALTISFEIFAGANYV